MTRDEIERRLGLNPGGTLIELAKLAEAVRPDSPSTAFDSLWFELPWLATSAPEPTRLFGSLKQLFGRRSSEEVFAPKWFSSMGTPVNVHPFAMTGGNSNHFGLLMDGDALIEDRPVVMVIPRAADADTQVVAPNLREFLGLLAIAFGEVISRSATDEEWFKFRDDWYGDDDPERIAEMRQHSDLLCERIPGVRRPTHPSRVANAHPALEFKLTPPFAAVSLPEVVRSEAGRARFASIDAHRALVEKDYDRAIELCQLGMQHPASFARSKYLLALALTRRGEVDRARSTIGEIVAAWLDDEPVAPPGIHTRRILTPPELSALLHESAYTDAERLSSRIAATGDVRDFDGDII